MTVNGWVAMLSRFKYALLALSLSSCANAYRYFPDPGSNEYLMDKAKACIDDYDFDCAVDSIDPVVVDLPNDPEVVQIAITAYAGRGNLRVLDLIQEISSGLSSTNLFAILAEHFPSATEVERLDVEHAVELLEAYESDAANRSDTMNILAFFLYYGEIGVIMSDYAYDGAATVAGSWDACSNSDVNLPDDQVQLVARALANLVDISDNLPGNSAVTDTFSSFAATISAYGLSKTIVCPDGALKCKALRMVIGNDSGGIGLGPDNSLICP